MIKKMLEDILQELRYHSKNCDGLWDAEDIARYMKLAKSTVQSRIICKPSFPRPLRVPTSDIGMGGRRWLAKEVKQWLSRHRDAIR